MFMLLLINCSALSLSNPNVGGGGGGIFQHEFKTIWISNLKLHDLS